jgi:hypothetical protein
MKPYNAFISSFLVSLAIAALIFFGIPFVFCLLVWKENFFSYDSLILTIPLAMYVVYVIIQFWLSVINLAQIVNRKAADETPQPTQILYSFLRAEAILYCVVFAVFTTIFGFFVAGYVLLFSIPYIICCTASVFYFRYFFITFSKSESHESQDDLAGIS